MFRKDAYSQFQILFAALLALATFGAVPAARADALPTAGPIHIDTSVSVSYVPSASDSAQTVTSNTASVIVPQTAGVFLSPVLGSQRIAHPTRSVYPVTVRNTGTGADTYTLSLVRTMGWGATLLNGDGTPAPASVTLAAGASRTFQVALTPPPAAAQTCSGMAVLKAVSSVSPAVYGQAAALTNCVGGYQSRLTSRVAAR